MLRWLSREYKTALDYSFYSCSFFLGFLFSGIMFLSSGILLGSGIVIILFGAIPFAFVYINYIKSEFRIDEESIYIKTGLIKKEYKISSDNVKKIKVKQGIIGNSLNYGTIIIIGKDGSKKTFRDVAHPSIFSSFIVSPGRMKNITPI